MSPRTLRAAAALVPVAALSGTSLAQSFSIPWYTIDAGGGTSTGASFVIAGTVGQHDAGVAMSGGVFTLIGGFWSGRAGNPCRADWNNSGAINSQDFFDFLNDFFAETADLNADGLTTSQDFFDFLTLFFSECA